MKIRRIWIVLSILTLISCFSEPRLSSAAITENGHQGLPWLSLLFPQKSFSLITPYVNESDIKEMHSGFSTYKDSPTWPLPPWGYVHDGFDIYPKLDPTYPDVGLKPYQAVCSGRVDWIYEGDEQVIVWLTCNSIYTIEINFETQAPGTGQEQRANIYVNEGQYVSQGQLIGKHYAPNDQAHVHFSFFRNWLTSCPEPYFTQQASNSMLSLIHVLFPGALMCYGDDPSPPPLVTPYVSEADMAEIRAGFSVTGNPAPWGGEHGGLDIYPQGDQKPFQAVCAGTIDKVELRQDTTDNNWEVEVLVACDDYVVDPDTGGYFIPYSSKYIFETMSTDQTDGQKQYDNITVSQNDVVAKGSPIGLLYTPTADSHVHFGLEMFASSFFVNLGAKIIPICLEPYFSTAANDSVMNLLHAAWPNASMCYY